MNKVMSLEDIQKKVINILATELKIDGSSITPEKSLKKDFGADSMTIVTLALILQEELAPLGIEIDDEELMEIDKVLDIFDLVEVKLA